MSLAAALLPACGWLLEGPPPAPAPLIARNAATATSTDEERSLGARSFTLRCQAPGVVRCVSFDSQDQIEERSGWRVGDQQGRGPMGLITSGPSDHPPALDCNVAVNGCSLRFTIPSRSGPGASGSWFVNFSDDHSVQFGEGEEFYVQWRQRFSREFLATRFRGGGWKQVIIGEGDRPHEAQGGKVVWSCTQLELVVVNASMRGFPQMYHSCGGKDGQFEGLPGYGAVEYAPEEWMTFQVRVKIGTWYRNDGRYHGDSRVELWVGREGQRSRRAVVATRYDLANTQTNARYGKLWLLPYHTGKDPKQEHPVGFTWYDEVIISRTPVPDP